MQRAHEIDCGARSGDGGALPSAERLAARAAELLRSWRVADTAITVAWNGRLTTTAGRAFVRKGHVELNPTLLLRAPDQVDAVLVHETAHVAAFRLFGGNIPAHGRHWRSLMRLAGCAPEVTHRIPVDDVRSARRQRFLYLRICEGCGERALLRAVRYGRCHGCGSRDQFAVFRAPASHAGRAALQRLVPGARGSFA